jgi:hypothetical protein
MSEALTRQDQAPAPFKTPAHAWLWCARLLQARRDGRAPRADLREGGPRLCTPDDILVWIQRLHDRGHITLEHARVMRDYGEKGRAPHPGWAGEQSDFVLWRQAMRALGVVLAAKGIVEPKREQIR